MKRVALLIETSRTYGRDLLQGVKQYAGEHGPWSLFVELRDLESKPPAWLKSWDGDGILTRSGSTAIASAVRRVGVPTVELRSTRRGASFPFVGADNEAVGRLVAEHLLDRGFRHFGVYELDTEPFFVERRNSFVRHLQRRGMTCSALRQGGTTEKPSQWERQQARLIEWIAQLPRPAGIMACTDQLGCWLLDACARTGVRVPEELAVVGVENDETLTAMSTPPLSSVQLDGRRAGYEAARLLDRLMQGSRSPRRPVLIPPVGIRTRQSSDIVAIDDPLLAQAIRLIRQRACEGIHVADVLEAVPLSRSSLERGCREILGRSPNREINRVRLQSACELLRETDLNLEQIALRTGFTTPQYLVQLFRRSMGTTPGVYRRQSRP
ncbi:DNA-binding transcriptional regulator [Maioricimonas sp. JC845]|uniref:AraC family transcriptional regulator n=1 Tax=Maioricimonas sp. JC845 TaxID=3232138 RepID=UPI003458053E